MSSPVVVNILGKEYQVACPEEEKSALIASAEMLHDSMEQIRGTGKVVGLDRIAVMAALNIAHELIGLKDQEGEANPETTEKLLSMKEKVNAFLREERQLDL
ncbi:MAG: cell division protein ZapA [Gammaproteobacteria bacterium]|jgi:cell division protein ZapA|nr:cell division protein ZapA [Gammaproteobacteria bacterium]